MNILIAESSMAMGGQELAVLLHADGLRRRGHAVRLVLEPGSAILRKAEAQGFAVEPVAMRRLRYPTAILTFRRLMQRHRPALVHVNSSRDSWIGGIAARLTSPRVPVVRSRHISTPLKQTFTTRLLYRRLMDFVIVTGSERTRRALIERDGLAADRVAAFPIGIDTEEFKPGPPATDLRKELGVPPSQRLVGLISYLRSYKGHEYFIEAAARVLPCAQEVTFLIVGEGPEARPLQARIAERHLTTQIRMLGFREDLVNIFRSLDLFVMPSVEGDTIPQVLMQALAMGLPVVSTTTGSIPDVVQHGTTGFVVPPRKADALAERIVALLGDPGLRIAMGRRGRALVEREYALSRMLDRLEEVYTKMARA